VNCFGCYASIPDAEDGEAVFCKTCEDKRKPQSPPKLSNEDPLRSPYFEGYPDRVEEHRIERSIQKWKGEKRA